MNGMGRWYLSFYSFGRNFFISFYLNIELSRHFRYVRSNIYKLIILETECVQNAIFFE